MTHYNNGATADPSSTSLGGKLREARIAGITAKAAEEVLAREAVSQIGQMLGDVGLRGIARRKKKTLLLPMNYSMSFEDTHTGGQWVLSGKGGPVATVCGLLYGGDIGGQEVFDQFILDLENGLLDQVAAFADAALDGGSVVSQGRRSLTVLSYRAKPQVVVATQGARVPLRPGWDYERAERLGDGTLIVPRERTFHCPPDVEFPCAASEGDDRIEAIRLALACKGTTSWLAFIGDGNLMPECTWDHLWGGTCEQGSGTFAPPEPSEEMGDVMAYAESIEFDVERDWAARWTRARVAQEIGSR